MTRWSRIQTTRWPQPSFWLSTQQRSTNPASHSYAGSTFQQTTSPSMDKNQQLTRVLVTTTHGVLPCWKSSQVSVMSIYSFFLGTKVECIRRRISSKYWPYGTCLTTRTAATDHLGHDRFRIWLHIQYRDWLNRRHSSVPRIKAGYWSSREIRYCRI